MSHNILSGNVSTPSSTRVELSGTFSGSYTGDGASLINVAHFGQQSPGATNSDRLLFFWLA